MRTRLLFVLAISLLLASDRPRLARQEKGDYHPIPNGAIKIPLPDIQQPDDYSCGAASFMSVASYFGAGPEDFDDMKKALGTNARTGTSVYKMADYARPPDPGPTGDKRVLWY